MKYLRYNFEQEINKKQHFLNKYGAIRKSNKRVGSGNRKT